MNDTLIKDYWEDEFLESSPFFAFLCVIVLGITAIIGTFGNLLIILVIFTDKKLNTPDSVFIVNLAMSDMFVTLVAIPFSIIAKTEGEDFFNQIHGLCQTIASMCTVSCVTSLMTIGLMSVNRYVYICVHDKYEKIFTKLNCICMCVSLYFIGGLLILLNVADIGDHGFDQKSLECLWDRMATYPYTVIFSITLVWIPSIIIGVCYMKIYMYVRKHCRRIKNQIRGTGKTSKHLHLGIAKSLFTVYAVFITCWAPYATLMVADTKNTFPKELHLFITLFAHLHPSANWIIYYITNTKFTKAYRQLLNKCLPCHLNTVVPVNSTSHVLASSRPEPRIKHLSVQPASAEEKNC